MNQPMFASFARRAICIFILLNLLDPWNGSVSTIALRAAVDEISVASRQGASAKVQKFEGVVLEDNVGEVIFQFPDKTKKIFPRDDVFIVDYQMDEYIIIGAKAMLRQGKPEEAIKTLQNWKPNRPTLEAMRIYYLGQAFFENNKPAEAEAQWKTLLQKYPKNYYVWDSLKMLMHVQIVLSRKPEAELTFNKAIQLARELKSTNREASFRTYWSQGASRPSNFSEGMIGVGGGRAGFGGPFADRRNAARTGTGASAKTESSVDAGLTWLARHQSDSGSWSAKSGSAICNIKNPCADLGNDTDEGAATALAALAFLGAGYDHRSTKEFAIHTNNRAAVRAGNVVKNGLRWLDDRRKSGEAQSELFNILSTCAFCEAYGLSRAPQWKAASNEMLAKLVANKTPAAGSGAEMDIHIRLWKVRALQAADRAGIVAPDAWRDETLALFRKYTDPAAQNNNSPNGRAAWMNLAILSGVKKDDPFLAECSKLLFENFPKKKEPPAAADLNYWNDGLFALHQFDGPGAASKSEGGQWKPWNGALTTLLYESQINDNNHCAHGSWSMEHGAGFESGRLFATAMNTLTLETYYRYPNLLYPKRAGAPPETDVDAESRPSEK